ncbi:hypothetical protein DFH07DRAFT_842623 [Mycena maculata]|uniref:Uncharacterized protein n=1 Tax=Mycena maculata TaxID=230809 RepID=A0AAD7MX27_9AGAR|nr:hypothetical protein DFH07DRAFT_842623 [Mycena maculata]
MSARPTTPACVAGTIVSLPTPAMAPALFRPKPDRPACPHLLPTTATFLILQQFICRRYYLAHDPGRIPPDGRIPEEMCAHPAIEERYAVFIALVALLDGVGSTSFSRTCMSHLT